MVNPHKNSTILVVISTPEYYRNFISSPALYKIKDRCVFIVHEKLMVKDFLGIKREQLVPYLYPERYKSWYRHFFYVDAWRYRHKSSSFAFRFEQLSSRRRKFYYKLASLPVIYNLVKFFVFKITRDKNLEGILSVINPQAILLPSGGYDGLSFEIIRIAKKKKIPTCLLIDNWDNLTSKTVLTRRPDYLVVWGKQAVEDAVRIHNMERSHVFPLGTPRFMEYMNRDGRDLPSPYNFKYILFAGIAAPFDELSTLKKLEEIIDRKGIGIKIIYRPHPWRKHRKCADTFFEYDFKHIVIDEQAKLYYKRDEMDEFNDVFMPDLKYYPKLLANMEFMICPLSTMMIEGLLFGKKVFVPVYDDGVHFTNPKNLLARHTHFKDINKFKNIYLIENTDDLEKIFTESFSQISEADGVKYANIFDFISPDTPNYPLELEKLVNQITNSHV
ncbi:MAG: hypothetical protein HYX20_03175 [Candidatus Yanofskybacteria bacterium]|nr:hypothetical protein [Candidatus Yanofskybacteria bacterium]